MAVRLAGGLLNVIVVPAALNVKADVEIIINDIEDSLNLSKI